MAIAQLSIDLVAKLATFEGDLKRVERLASGAASQIGGAFSAIAPQLASAFSVAAVVNFTKAAIDSADAFNDLTQKTGIGIKSLAAYQLAAEQSGTNIEAIAKGIKALSTEMVKNGDALKAAGIDAKDADGALRQIADLFAKMPDGVEKSAIASELFGSKLGTELIPMLNLGAEGLDESAAASSRFGAAMLATAPAADALNDSISEIAINTKAMTAEFAAGLLPTLQAIANEMLRGSKETGGFTAAGQALGTVLQTVSVLGANVAYVFTQIGVDIAYMVEQGRALASLDFTRFAQLGEQARAAAAAARVEVDALSERLLNPAPLKLPDVKEPAADLEKYRKQWDALLKSLAKPATAARAPRAAAVRAASFADYDQQVAQKVAQAIEKTDIVKGAELVRQLEKLNELAAAGLDPTIVKAVRDDLSGATKTAADELARLNGLLEATPTAKLAAARDDMLLLTAALEKGKVSEEKYLEAVIVRLDTMSEKTQEAIGEMDEFTKAAAKNIQNTLADFLFDPFSEGLDGMAQKFGQVIQRMIADAAAAQLAKALFGDMGKDGKLGGLVGQGLGFLTESLGFHQGGLVGAGGHSFSRSVPTAAFFNAPRFHNGGFAANEVPAILQKGELVLTKDQQRGMKQSAPPMNQVMNFYGAAEPAQVKRAAAAGARSVLGVANGARRYG